MLNNNTTPTENLEQEVWKGSGTKALIVLDGPDQPQLGPAPKTISQELP